MELTSKELLKVWREGGIVDETNKLIYELVSEGDWVDEGKFQTQEVVIREVTTDKHYLFFVYRSGSYFTDYDYEILDDAVEVKKVTETITVEKWARV